MRMHHPFRESIQRHIVIAGNHQTRNITQLCEKRLSLFKLFSLRALSQVTADDDRVGIQLRRDSQHGLANLVNVRRSKMQI